jgi:hypothetical protein
LLKSAFGLRLSALAFEISEVRRGCTMSETINPEAAEPSSVQSAVMSDRNPVVAEFGESGGPVASPTASESRVTPEGAAVSPDAGLKY